MSFKNSIAKIFYDRVERDLGKFDLSMKSLSTYFEEQRANHGKKVGNKIVTEFVASLEYKLSTHEGLLSLTSARIKGNLYGHPYNYMSLFHLGNDEETANFSVNHVGFCLSRKKKFMSIFHIMNFQYY
jgi:hypothetical protein